MAKIEHDKYYTPDDVAEKCVDLFLKSVSPDEITECIEPAVGGGAFVRAMRKAGLSVAWAGDIIPEFDDEIVETVDFLEKQFDYKKGRAVITNPPFGHSNNLSRKFYNRSCEIGDFIGMVLPVGQLNNSVSFYRFDLVASHDLGELPYSGRHLHCCFNIYRRPAGGNLNNRVVWEPVGWKCYSVRRHPDKTNTPEWKPDVRIGTYGEGFVGRVLEEHESSCQDLWFSFEDENQKAMFLSFDWRAYAFTFPRTTASYLTRQQVIRKCGELGLPVRLSDAPSTHSLF